MPPLLKADTLKIVGQLSTVGLSFVFALVMGFGGGLWLDGLLGTKPWLTLLGFVVGLAAGVLNVVRIMKGITRMEQDRARADSAERPRAPRSGR